MAALEGRDHRVVAARGPRRHRRLEGGAPADGVRARQAGEDRTAVDLGVNWIADKSRAGDDATPEGRYRIVSRSGGERVHLLQGPAARLSRTPRTAPSSAARGGTGTCLASAGIGGLIEIHGEGGRGRDWTKGCIALTNADMDDLFERVGVGTPVTIVGSDDFGAIAEFAARAPGRHRRTPVLNPRGPTTGCGRRADVARAGGIRPGRAPGRRRPPPPPRRIGPIPLNRRTGYRRRRRGRRCSLSSRGPAPAIATSPTSTTPPRCPRPRRRATQRTTTAVQSPPARPTNGS